MANVGSSIDKGSVIAIEDLSNIENWVRQNFLRAHGEGSISEHACLQTWFDSGAIQTGSQVSRK